MNDSYRKFCIFLVILDKSIRLYRYFLYYICKNSGVQPRSLWIMILFSIEAQGASPQCGPDARAGNALRTLAMNQHPFGPSAGTAEVKAIPHNGASAFAERFCPKGKCGKSGNTGCISLFSHCTIGAKDSAKAAVSTQRCCLNCCLYDFAVISSQRARWIALATYFSSFSAHSFSRKPVRTKSSPTTTGRLTSIPSEASRRSCSSWVMVGSFSFRFRDL